MGGEGRDSVIDRNDATSVHSARIWDFKEIQPVIHTALTFSVKLVVLLAFQNEK